MIQGKFISAIITAAGAGTRMGPEGKLHLEIAGESVLFRTLRTFSELSWLDELIVVVRPGEEDRAREQIMRLRFSYPVKYAQGGEQRQDSVQNGLAALDPAADMVLIHDGARPFVQAEDIRRVGEALLDHPAVALAVPMTDTVKIVRTDLSVLATPDRSTLYRVQTPQGFQLPVLLRAYEEAAKEGVTGTDDCSMVERLGVRVQLLPGQETNIKITTRADLHFGKGIAEEE